VLKHSASKSPSVASRPLETENKIRLLDI